MKNLLIIGINGTVGQAVKDFAEKSGYQVFGTTSRENQQSDKLFFLDLLDHESISNFKLPTTIDHVLITAGKEPQFNLLQSSEIHVLDMFGVHIIGPILLMKNLEGKINAGGSVTLISSPAAYKGSYDPSYAAVKGAINALVRTLAKDLAPNIRVNAFAPGLIENSPVFDRMTPDFREKHLNATLTKKNTTALDCAKSILFLMESEQITGQILHVNGGMIYGS